MYLQWIGLKQPSMNSFLKKSALWFRVMSKHLDLNKKKITSIMNVRAIIANETHTCTQQTCTIYYQYTKCERIKKSAIEWMRKIRMLFRDVNTIANNVRQWKYSNIESPTPLIERDANRRDLEEASERKEFRSAISRACVCAHFSSFMSLLFIAANPNSDRAHRTI